MGTLIDFNHTNAEKYWKKQLETFRAVVDFDGIWLDMNEPGSYCDGDYAIEAWMNLNPEPTKPWICPVENYNLPKLNNLEPDYVMAEIGNLGSLNIRTVSTNATFLDGSVMVRFKIMTSVMESNFIL